MLCPHVRLFREKHFGHLGLTVDLMSAVVNMEDVGYNTKTQSIDVISGVYVPVLRKHEQCLILMRQNIFVFVFFLPFWSETFATFVESDDFTDGWPLRNLALAVNRTSWRRASMQIQRTGEL